MTKKSNKAILRETKNTIKDIYYIARVIKIIESMYYESKDFLQNIIASISQIWQL